MGSARASSRPFRASESGGSAMQKAPRRHLRWWDTPSKVCEHASGGPYGVSIFGFTFSSAVDMVRLRMSLGSEFREEEGEGRVSCSERLSKPDQAER